MRCSWSSWPTPLASTHAVPQALLQPVPPIQPERRSTGQGRQHDGLAGAVPRQNGRHRDPGALGQHREAHALIRGSSPRPTPAAHARRDAAQPYFWQVDQSGQQLPYIDRLNFSIAQDVESLMPSTLLGKLDIQERHIDSLQNKPTLSQNMQKGGYRLIELIARCAAGADLPEPHAQGPEDAREMFGKQAVPPGAVAGHEPQGDHRSGLPGPVAAPTRPARARPPLAQREACAVHQLRPEVGQRHPGQGCQRARDAQQDAPASDGQKLFFAIDVIPTPTWMRSTRWSSSAPLGRDRRRHEGQHHRARAVLHPRRQSHHDRGGLALARRSGPMLDARDYFAQHPAGSAPRDPVDVGSPPAARTARSRLRPRKSRMKPSTTPATADI